MLSVQISWLGFLVAAAAAMVLGMLWYGPLFGKAWMSLTGVTSTKGAARGYIVNTFSTLLMSYVLAHFIEYTRALDIPLALQTAFWIWLGFIATISLGTVIWEGKPFRLYVLNNAYNLLALLVMGAVYVLMG